MIFIDAEKSGHVKMLMLVSMVMALGVANGAQTVVKKPPESLTEGPVMMKAAEGENARFECPVFSQPQAFVTWSKNGSSIGQGWMRFRTIRNNLRIANVSRQDSGWYSCLAVNGFGSLVVKLHLEVVTADENTTRVSSKSPESPDNEEVHFTTHHAPKTESTTDVTGPTDVQENEPDHTGTPGTHLSTPKRSDHLKPKEVYVMIATGLMFLAIFVCIVFILILARLACGPSSSRRRKQVRVRPGFSQTAEKLLTTRDDFDFSSSASQLLVASTSPAATDQSQIAAEDQQTTWSMLDVAALTGWNQQQHRGNLKF